MKSIFLLSFLIFSFSRTMDIEKRFANSSHFAIQEDIRTAAFNVLTTQCNVCHATKKRQDIFTFVNMDSFAIDINRQVFIKKKMPMGRKNILSEKDSLALKDWLKIILFE